MKDLSISIRLSALRFIDSTRLRHFHLVTAFEALEVLFIAPTGSWAVEWSAELLQLIIYGVRVTGVEGGDLSPVLWAPGVGDRNAIGYLAATMDRYKSLLPAVTPAENNPHRAAKLIWNNLFAGRGLLTDVLAKHQIWRLLIEAADDKENVVVELLKRDFEREIMSLDAKRLLVATAGMDIAI